MTTKKEGTDLVKTETTGISKVIDVNVTKNDIIDMVINEEIAKANKTLETLKNSYDATRKEIDDLDKKQKVDLKKLVSVALNKAFEATIKKLKLFKPIGMTVVFSDLAKEIVIMDLKGESVEERAHHYKRHDRSRMMLGMWPMMGGGFYEGHGHPNMENFNKLSAFLLTKEQLKKIKIDEHGLTNGPIDDYSILVSLDFPKVDTKEYVKTEAKIKKLQEFSKKQNENLNNLRHEISTIKDKREEVKAGLTRTALTQSAEGKTVLGELEKVKANFGITFDSKKYEI